VAADVFLRKARRLWRIHSFSRVPLLIEFDCETTGDLFLGTRFCNHSTRYALTGAIWVTNGIRATQSAPMSRCNASLPDFSIPLIVPSYCGLAMHSP
jgi:hypothetical protein